MRRWKAEDRCLYDIWRYHGIQNRTMYGVAREAEATPLKREMIEEYSCMIFSMRSILKAASRFLLRTQGRKSLLT